MRSAAALVRHSVFCFLFFVFFLCFSLRCHMPHDTVNALTECIHFDVQELTYCPSKGTVVIPIPAKHSMFSMFST